MRRPPFYREQRQFHTTARDMNRVQRLYRAIRLRPSPALSLQGAVFYRLLAEPDRNSWRIRSGDNAFSNGV